MTAVCYGIVFPASRGILTPAKYCAEAEAFFARLSTQPSAARKLLYDTLIRALVAAGVWSKLDALYVLAAADQATALTNLVQSSYGATAVNSPTFTADQGFTFAATKRLDTGFNGSTAGGKYGLNSASSGAWGKHTTAMAGILLSSTFGAGLELVPRFTDNNFYFSINDGTEASVAETGDASGLRVITRTASNALKAYKNNSVAATKTTASTAIPNANIVIGSYPDGTIAYADNIYLAFIGGGLTDQNEADLYAAAHAVLQGIAGIP